MVSNKLIVLIPGTTATSLIDPINNQVVWGGTASEVVLDADADNAPAADKLLESPLAVGTIAGWIPAQPVGYGALQMLLANQYGFDTALITGTADLPSKLGTQQLLGFAYDWRRDNQYTAGILQNVLEQVDRTYSAAGQSYEIWLIGHSMGGLVARALLEPNAKSTASWYANIRGLITLGTPHLGAPLALQAILNELPSLIVPQYLDPVIVNFVNYNGANGLYDSTYELLPPPQVPFVKETGNGTLSVFDQQLQTQLLTDGASQSNFSGALKFFTDGLWNYNVQNPPQSPKPYYCVYGTGLPTTCSFLYTPPNTWQPQFGPFDLGGDGIVPTTSAQFTQARPVQSHEAPFVNHLKLITDPGVLGNVVGWMGL